MMISRITICLTSRAFLINAISLVDLKGGEVLAAGEVYTNEPIKTVLS